MLVLLILAALWAAVLLPPMLRARAEGSPADSIVSFRRQLNVLQRTGPYAAQPPILRPRPVPSVGPGLPSPSHSSHPSAPLRTTAAARPASTHAAVKRRRDVFCGLLAAMGGSLLLGFVDSLRVMWGLHVVLDLLFIGYVALLIRIRNAAAEREMKVRLLPHSSAPEPALLLRRSSNY